MIKEHAPGMPAVHYNTSGMPINCKTQVLRDETNVIVTGSRLSRMKAKGP